MRSRARRDDNHREVVEALRGMGATVQDLGAVGKGCPDVLVGFRGQNFVLEIKDGRKPPSARKLTDDEKKWHETWRGQTAIVNSSFEAFQAIGAVEFKAS
jgi:hypothetical protein